MRAGDAGNAKKESTGLEWLLAKREMKRGDEKGKQDTKAEEEAAL